MAGMGGEDLIVAGRKSLAARVYEAVQSAILTGVFEPEERLIETEPAARLNVSRTPLREALNRLESEGLLHRLKSGGFEVVGFTEKDVRDLFDTRLVLEQYLVDLAIQNITPSEIEALKHHIEDAERYTERGDTARVAASHGQFHAILHRAIVESIERHDLQSARAITANHINRSKEILLRAHSRP